MSSIERVCIYFTLMLYVRGPGEVLPLEMGIFTWEWLFISHLWILQQESNML